MLRQRSQGELSPFVIMWGWEVLWWTNVLNYVSHLRGSGLTLSQSMKSLSATRLRRKGRKRKKERKKEGRKERKKEGRKERKKERKNKVIKIKKFLNIIKKIFKVIKKRMKEESNQAKKQIHQ